MRRVVLGLYTYAEFFAVAVALFPVFLLVAAWKRGTDPTCRARGRVMRFLGRFTSSITPMWRFSVSGTRPADIDQRGYVVVSNHQSIADMFLLSHLPFDMRFIAKAELFKLPYIGWLLRCSGDIPIGRRDGGSIRVAMAELHRTLIHGMSVMIFPEGTRSRDGQLLPFKNGAFKLAIEAQAPVLPVLLEGTRDCMPAKSAWFGEARGTAEILAPIETAGLTLADVAALRDLTRDRIVEARRRRSGDLPATTTVAETAAARR
jgi:1-acyl-sn-glycerol-3-phosphate acyltransferase